MARRLYYILFSVALLLTACTEQKSEYKIGVSQCSEDIWRDKLNSELRVGTYFYEGTELHFRSADDSDERQIEQINQFVDEEVDLLIVAPNSSVNITPAIDRAFDKGIPVIVFDRKTNSDKFTAYIGADNYEMGRLMGEFIANQLRGQGRVVEILGLKDSSPATERHNGFLSAISRYPGITLVASLQGDWTEESAVQVVEESKKGLGQVDFVFGQNDRMAFGASKVLGRKHTRYCGIDGLPGPEGGIQMVRDSVLTASYIYPTRGDLVMRLALNILQGRPFKRENLMKSAFVTPENAEVMLLQAEEMEDQHEELDMLHEKIDHYLAQYRSQQIYIALMLIILLLVVGTALFIILDLRRRHEMERETFALVVQEPATNVVVPEEPTPSVPVPDVPVSEEPVTEEPKVVEVPEETPEALPDSPFLELLRQQVREHIADSSYSVEDLARDMALSRVQLYRKVKLLTGRSPVDIIRQSRLNHARNVLAQGGKTVSEVAYEVGFSAPSYFTKCFKDEFGISPSDV